MAGIGYSDRIKVVFARSRKYAGHSTVESFVRTYPKGERAALRSLRRDVRAGFIRILRGRRKSDPEARWAVAAGVRNWLPVQRPTGADLDQIRAAYQRSGVAMAIAGSSDAESEAVAAYTGNDYDPINHSLRTTGGVDTAYQQHVDNLDRIILSSKFLNDTIMYRGYGHSAVLQNNAPPPDQFTDHGYTSASYNPAVALKFCNRKTIYRLRIPAGTPGLAASRKGGALDDMLSDEAEVILPRGTSFSILRRNPNEAYSGTLDVVDVLVVPPKKG